MNVKNTMNLRVPCVVIPLLLAVAGINSGCASVTRVGASVGQAAGVITPQQADSLVKSADAVEKTFEDITPEQEYYIGRAVGATIVSTYNVYDNVEATKYLNLIGQSAARFSEMPSTFKGYHFLILDTDEINAFASPGGFIFISRGMIKLCRTEDDLAAVVAHEIGHIQLKHAISAIKSSRLTSALTTIAVESAKSLTSDSISQLTEAFEGSITDITKTMMNSGYARGQERAADKAAIAILRNMGYRQASLPDVLERMAHVTKESDSSGFGATHPPPQERVSDLKKIIDDSRTPLPTAGRQERFNLAFGNF